LDVDAFTRVKMDIPEDFHHPFHPYQIQNDFMKALYSTIDSKSVGIFESPTGTVIFQVKGTLLTSQGKSLSLICGSLTWLRIHKRWLLENGDEEATISGIATKKTSLPLRVRACMGVGIREK